MPKEINPQVLQMVLQTMGGGQQMDPKMLQGVMATLAAMKASEMIPKPKKPNAIQGEGELGRSRPCVAPLQTRGAVIPDLEAEGEGLPVDRDGAAVGCPAALVELVALAGRHGRDLSTSYG